LSSGRFRDLAWCSAVSTLVQRRPGFSDAGLHRHRDRREEFVPEQEWVPSGLVLGENMESLQLGNFPAPDTLDATTHSACAPHLNEVIAKRLGLYGRRA
jgi:hypothetical protein